MGQTLLSNAELVGSWSKDPSTQVGAVITKKNRIVSVGFNGYPHGISDSADTDERDMKYLKTLHAEENAILFAKRDLDECEIWVTHFPCPNCAAKIIQTGIKAVHCPHRMKISCLAGEKKFRLAKICLSKPASK
ncbi:dCMP deaminase [Vibrio ishigakensis]|uniref:dCMP deaminase n=1 Tax=Vibrio ishigakensis TaxID=1481914 RepID=A0A0B8PAX0_9VIBR|nr:dCMP deaminase [Vibrio ishigakensis]